MISWSLSLRRRQLYGVEGLPEHVKSLVSRCISERIASAAENSGLRNSLVQLSGDFAESTASLLDVRARSALPGARGGLESH